MKAAWTATLKLVFQPYIENSIKHGFNGIPWRKHLFCVKAGEKDPLITIADNEGMETSNLKSFLAQLEKDDLMTFRIKMKSIGIPNIHYRSVKIGAKCYHSNHHCKKGKACVRNSGHIPGYKRPPIEFLIGDDESLIRLIKAGWLKKSRYGI